MKCLFTRIQSSIAICQYVAIHSNAIRNMALIRIVSPLQSIGDNPLADRDLLCEQETRNSHDL